MLSQSASVSLTSSKKVTNLDYALVGNGGILYGDELIISNVL